ncbi:hypothetical protein FDECE_8641 [Fusarium decemcellulare]|nr:hypothetical protein FDECE_8641 [Fusarium decemcellulare]
MDMFTRLPPELIAPVLQSLPDLRSLFNVTISSPYVFHFMGSSMGADVLDSILQRPFSDLALTPWIPQMLRLVALVRQCTPVNPPAADLSSFLTTHIMPTSYQNAQGERIPDLQSRPPACIPRTQLRDVMKPENNAIMPREMLFLAWRIDRLAMSCFNFFHERIRSSQPQHLADKCFRLVALRWDHRPDGIPWGQPYPMDAGGRASWYEMQRITLGFWSLQLCYELSNAAAEGRLGWSDTDVEVLRDMGSGRCLAGFEKSSLWIAREPLWAALTYVRHLEGSSDDSPCVGDINDADDSMGAFFNTGFLSLPSGYLRLPSPKNAKGVKLDWPSPAPPPPFSCTNPLDAATYHCHKVLVGCKGVRWAGPLLCPRGTPRLGEGLLFRPFRALGFGIWDDERLVAMEMLDDPDRKRPRRFQVWCQDQAFTWMSMLDRKQKEELQEYQEKRRLRLGTEEAGETAEVSN